MQEDVLETLDKLENVEFIRNSEITQEELEQKEKKMKVKIDDLNKKPKKSTFNLIYFCAQIKLN